MITHSAINYAPPLSRRVFLDGKNSAARRARMGLCRLIVASAVLFDAFAATKEKRTNKILRAVSGLLSPAPLPYISPNLRWEATTLLDARPILDVRERRSRVNILGT